MNVANRNKGSRQGMSLVETLVVMMVSAAVLGVVSVALAALFDVDRQHRSADRDQTEQSLLIDAIRTDAWAAQQLEWDAQEKNLRLAAAGSPAVEYRFGDSAATRETDDAEHPERFALSPRHKIEIEPTAAEAGGLVTIGFADGQAATFQVGRDLRLLHD